MVRARLLLVALLAGCTSAHTPDHLVVGHYQAMQSVQVPQANGEGEQLACDGGLVHELRVSWHGQDLASSTWQVRWADEPAWAKTAVVQTWPDDGGGRTAHVDACGAADGRISQLRVIAGSKVLAQGDVPKG